MASNAATPTLTAEEVQQFHHDGYVLHRRPVFSEAEFAELKDIFETLLAKYGEDDLDTIHFRHPELLKFLIHPNVIALVEPLIGPNIGLWSSHFICKPPFKGKATPWHEDSSYWNGRVSTMEGIVTVWLALDPVFPENGSMAVIPGTHVNGFSQYKDVDTANNIFNSEIAEVDEDKAVYFTLDPNECSLHESRIIHGAKANTSPHRRAGYTMRYFPTTSKIMAERNENHRVWLVSGEDLAGNRYENV